MDSIQLDQVGKKIGRQWILKPQSLKISQGETVILSGANGCGKTTLLKLIATLTSASAGRLTLFGQDAEERTPSIRRKIRFLGHEKQIYPNLTAYENLRLAADLLETPSDRSALNPVMERVGIVNHQNQRVGQLSEGMKKRLGLARLLLKDSEANLFLLDEPHNSLDDEGREILDGMMSEWRREGKTIILSTHHPEKVPADRLLLMKDGQVREAPL